jgi:hypothetical protein
MIDKLHFLNEYIDILRDIVSSKSMKEEKANEEFNSKMKRLLKLEDENDLNVIYASFDVIGDTSLAIEHFKKFGLSGATKYDEVGEKYLRLYGVLNAIYLNKEAVLSLYNKFKIDNYKEVKNNIEKLKILNIRHKIGAHSVNYKNGNDEIECYTPSRITMTEKELEFYNMDISKHEFETINLDELISEYLEEIFSVVEKLVQGFVNKIFKTNANIKKDYLEKIDLISKQIKGEVIVINTFDSKKFIDIEWI